ncbi:Zinc finger ccch domain-containing protein [Thalictrum thalictroides]|uniref:Zinc finger ccch domain-containing protein n=1 Tax=Thalictrum thalictroides TaxID=46969 RepID=A0A7J6VBI9_THATH|nr:Zinc finger ccch domain-containing protein [Thalictrum thalictroides]
MEDELQKRNTDCVYFLASPLTCKKGGECEYRHSEIARLNPRDCWYWLAGSCLNPTCAFRHPPLEGRSENPSESSSLPNQASVPVSKSNVPCYFYFNGFCNKGDNCSFQHGPNIVTSGQFLKSASIVSDVHLSENKTLATNNEGISTLTCNQLETTKTVGQGIQFQSKIECQPLTSNNILQQSPSPRNSLPESDEAIIKSEILLPAPNLRSPLCEDRSPFCADQCSEDQFDSHIEPDERGESSPGFDVLVDDGSENLGFDDDQEYLVAHKREDRVFQEHLLPYEYEDQVGYDPGEYPDLGLMYEHDMYRSYGRHEDDHISDHVRRIPKRSREMMQNGVVLQKRQILPREADFNNRNGPDLRNHLSKRRRVTSRSKRSRLQEIPYSNMNGRVQERPHSYQNGWIQERLGKRHNRQRLQGRLASDVSSDMLGGHSENDSYQQGLPRQSHPRRIRSKQQGRERRRQARPRFTFSEKSRGNSASREAQPFQDSSTVFTGPKTLDQIKEEKRKARQNRDGFCSPTLNGTTTSFEGPKPLSKILKDKRRLGSTSDDNTSSRSRHNLSESERTSIGFDIDNDDLLDEYGDDDEA